MNEYPDRELNYRAWILTLLFIGALLYFIIPIFTATPEGYYKDASGNNVKLPYGFVLNGSGYPVELVTPTPIIINNTIYVTSTPDNGIYYVPDTMNGTRKLGRYFIFHRNDVSGLKDLDFHVTVYGYKFLDSYHWYNYHDANYYENVPSSPDNQFLFIYIQIYTDTLSGDDVRPFIPDASNFFINYNETLYSPIPFEEELMIHELENTNNLNDDSKIKYFGQYVNHPLSGGDEGKYISVPQYWLFGGKSNAEDGYLVFEIPKEAQPNDITVLSSFYAYGYSNWVLKT